MAISKRSRPSSPPLLRRYTHALSLLDTLRHQRLTLLPPTRWYDRNDAVALELYSEMKGIGRVYALCMAQQAERAHHWQLFAGGNHGVCIFLDKDKLMDQLSRLEVDMLHGPVRYKTTAQLRRSALIERDELPFLKRETFGDEREYRLVCWQAQRFAGETFQFHIDPSVIQKVTFGPAMPRSLADTLQSVAAEQPGCGHIRFMRSRLDNNQVWHDVLTERANAKEL